MMATRTDTQSPALHVADSHDLIRVQGARENYPIILRSARGAHRYSPKCPEGEFCELRLWLEFSEVRLSSMLSSVLMYSKEQNSPVLYIRS
jgi:hypothetical protein